MGLTFCFTGKTYCFDNRDTIKRFLEGQGCKLTSSVSQKTNYLVTNDPYSGSSKNRKAQELGINVITESSMIDLALSSNGGLGGKLYSAPNKEIMKALFLHFWGNPKEWYFVCDTQAEGIASEGGDVWVGGVECCNDGSLLVYQK